MIAQQSHFFFGTPGGSETTDGRLEVASNIEIKAQLRDKVAATKALADLGLVLTKDYEQTDRYFRSETHYVKLRSNDGKPSSLIGYKRSISPTAKESSYAKYDLSEKDDIFLLEKVMRCISSVGEVHKHRKVYRSSDTIVNVDDVQGFGSIIEIELELTKLSLASVEEYLAHLAKMIGISQCDLIPYSNIHLVNMIASANRYYDCVANDNPGLLLAVDGPSGSGKSTIKSLLEEEDDFVSVPRETTRMPRPDDETTGDYNFIDQREYFARAIAGEYAEFRDYDFGMSYGLSWNSFMQHVAAGRNTVALINLGNGPLLKRMWKGTLTILLRADESIIRNRLNLRGSLRPEQIEERILNSRSVSSLTGCYDLVIDTGMHSPGECVRLIMEAARRYGRD